MASHCHVQRAPWFWGICGAGRCSWCRNSDCVCLPLVACICFWFLFPSPTLAGFFCSLWWLLLAHLLGCSRIPCSTMVWVLTPMSFPSCSTDSAWVGWVSAARAFNLLLALLLTFLWSLVPPRAISFLCQIPQLLTCSPCRYLEPSVFTLCSCFLPQMPIFVLIPMG